MIIRAGSDPLSNRKWSSDLFCFINLRRLKGGSKDLVPELDGDTEADKAVLVVVLHVILQHRLRVGEAGLPVVQVVVPHLVSYVVDVDPDEER